MFHSQVSSKGHDLGAGAVAVFFGEGDVVVLAAVEGRVEVLLFHFLTHG
jgi:hypothetical protein